MRLIKVPFPRSSAACASSDDNRRRLMMNVTARGKSPGPPDGVARARELSPPACLVDVLLGAV
ncbi:MAG: hypothetical protein J5J00_02620 [Deltaproteobacteria bacterium]|nr:hypothetical protein [Deltaproteobacteria bacterium]